MSLLLLIWLGAVFVIEPLRFAVADPVAQASVEAAAALARLFGALVLFLFPAERGGQRLRWIAGGFVLLALGGVIFGYAPPLFGTSLDLNSSMYAWLAVRSLANGLFVIGLLAPSPPPFTRRHLLQTMLILAGLVVAVLSTAHRLPPLSTAGVEIEALAESYPILPGLTPWYWMLSLAPMALALAAAVGAVRQRLAGRVGDWLVVAMVLLAGSQLHGLFWPSTYSTVLTTADLLRLSFAAVVVAGGVVELRRIAAEWTAMLAIEREQSRRLAELTVLKADFTAMVAHELGSPLAAIQVMTNMLATEALAREERAAVMTMMRREVDLLKALVADVQQAAAVERDDFAIQPRPVLVRDLLEEATGFARTLPGDHPLMISGADNENVWVWADQERIAQVLHNLLSNASKYSAPGTPIEVRIVLRGGRVRIEVADYGPGIAPDEQARIFEKFRRGQQRDGERLAGIGLGLYLSRRIMRAHGSDLLLSSTPGVGSVFAFELAEVR